MSFNPMKSIILKMLRNKLANLQKVEPEQINFVDFKVDKVNGKLGIFSNIGGAENNLSEFSEFSEMLEEQFSKKIKVNKLVFYTLKIDFKSKSVNSELFYQDEKGNKLNLTINDVF